MLSAFIGAFLDNIRTYFGGFVSVEYTSASVRAIEVGSEVKELTEPIHGPGVEPQNNSRLSLMRSSEHLPAFCNITKQCTNEDNGYPATSEFATSVPNDNEYILCLPISAGRRVSFPQDSLHLYRNRNPNVHKVSHLQKKRAHYFSPIPLEGDTFCDFCSQPIYGLGWGPVCQRCAVCHMTCHWSCKASVRIGCKSIAVSKSNNGQEMESSGLTKLLEGGQRTPFSTVRRNGTTDKDTKTADRFVLDHVDQTNVFLDTPVNGCSDTDDSCRLKLPNTGLVRHHTDVDRSRRSKKTKLVARHSFLAGQTSGAPLSVRLSYDFSSLDKEAIRANGICVRDWSSSFGETVLSEHPSAPVTPKSPPLPPRRISSLSRPSQPNLQITEQREQSVELSPTTLPITHSPSTPVFSASGSASYGFASVIQTTESFVQARPKRKMERRVFVPAPSVPLVSRPVGPRDTLPWRESELTERIKVFNTNEFGLQANETSTLVDGDCEGQVRIHINLLRPIRMLLTSRPTSIFDVVGYYEDHDAGGDSFVEVEQLDHVPARAASTTGHRVKRTYSTTYGPTHYSPPKSAVTATPTVFQFSDPNVQRRKTNRIAAKSAMFWVPRGSTKVLHVHLSTTARKVISALLERFQIEDNPQKFALYEHTIEGDQEVSVRKLFDDESPLGLLLRWTEGESTDFNQVLSLKRLVLQENETGDIEWMNFSLPELKTFLGILNHEEADYRRRIELKYTVRRKEVLRLLALYEKQESAVPDSPLPSENTNFQENTEAVSDSDHEDRDENFRTFNHATTLPPQSVRNPVVEPSDREPDAQQHEYPTLPPVSASNHDYQTNLEAVQDGLQTLAVDHLDQKQSKRTLRLQEKQLAKMEKRRLKAEKKQRLKTLKQQAQVSSKARGWFGNFAHTLSPNRQVPEAATTSVHRP